MTGSSLWTLVVLALTAALSPFSLVAFSLVLATTRGPRNGIAFILGWIFTVMLVGVAVSLLGASIEFNQSNTAGKWTLALELALGAVLLLAWTRRRLRARTPAPVSGAAAERPAGEPGAPEPGWQQRLSTMGYGGAFVAGGLVQTWPVMIAAALEIARLDVDGPVKVGWMLLFAIATTAGIVVLEVLAWRAPESAADRLDRIRAYVATHRDAVINWLFLLGGLWLFFRGLFGVLGHAG